MDESAEMQFCDSRQLNMSTLRMTSEAKVLLQASLLSHPSIPLHSLGFLRVLGSKVIQSVPRQLSVCESSSLVPMRGAVELYKKLRS